MARILLDAGHGGSDPGAVNGNRYEKNDNLKLALEIKKELEQNGHAVSLTRFDNKTLGLNDRVAMSNQGYDYFLSLHRNAFSQATAKGVEIWVATNASENSKKIANAIIDNVKVIDGVENRGIKVGYPGKPDANFAVNKSKAPSGLLELLFISNPDDNALFDKDFTLFIKAIANGIYEVLGKKEKPVEIVKPAETVKPTEKPVAKPKNPKAGQVVALDKAPIYTTAYNEQPANRISGLYFIYDGIEHNGRYRITNRADRVNKKPAGANVTGWVKKTYIK